MVEKHRGQVLLELLEGVPHARFAEVGVYDGRTSEYLLKRLDIETYFLVDPWRVYEDYGERDSMFCGLDTAVQKQAMLDGLRERCIERLLPFAERVRFLPMMSEGAAHWVPLRSLDGVFIDGNHDEAYVREDILIWSSRLRRGGLLAGHDYGRHGVTEAVGALLPHAEKGPNKTWWVRV